MLMCDEWGDKSQLAAIAIAANYNSLGVILGGCLAHYCSIVISIIVGMIVKNLISERMLNFLGGLLFIGFGVWMIFEL